MLAVALAQPRHVISDVRRGHTGEVAHTGRGQRHEIAIKISAVRAERVGRQSPLDSQMVQVRPDGTPQDR
jgi:hypothetical protein